jgi:hypothetical protein
VLTVLYDRAGQTNPEKSNRGEKPQTKRQLYRRNRRPLGEPVGQRVLLHEEPAHEKRRPGYRLDADEQNELRALFRADPAAALQSLLYYRAESAGQVTYANLYAASESIETPTEREAEEILEIGFRQGHSWDTWIVSTPEKKTWTVGTTWKRPYNFRDHLKGAWYHGIVQHPQEELGRTDWITLDLDRHSGHVPAALHVQRLRELHELLAAEGWPAVLQVNPKNGSSQAWVYVGRGLPYASARRIVESWRRRLPWLGKVEIFPDNLHQVILPLRPDKMLVCDALVPKVKRRGFKYNPLTGKKKGYRYHAWSCVYVWQWLQDPHTAPWEVWEGVLAEACARTADAALLPEEKDERPRHQRRRQKRRERKHHTGAGLGSVGPLKGRWLRLLRETYVEGARPPDDTIGILEASVIRYCRVGAGLSADETRSILKMLRQRLPDKSFSDRLTYDEAELEGKAVQVLRPSAEQLDWFQARKERPRKVPLYEAGEDRPWEGMTDQEIVEWVSDPAVSDYARLVRHIRYCGRYSMAEMGAIRQKAERVWFAAGDVRAVARPRRNTRSSSGRASSSARTRTPC